MRVHLATDHRGFEVKEQIKKLLQEQGVTVQDHGNTEYDPQDDYVDFALPAAKAVVQDDESRGIVFCGSGVGVCVTANKVDGVRCVLGFDAKQVEHARERDNCTVLAVPVDFLSQEAVTELVQVFLQTRYKNLERDERRIKKIAELEAKE